MECVNYVVLVGNIGKDPEIRVLETGVKMARFSLATSEYYIDKQGVRQKHTQWHSIVCWRSEAEFAQWNFRTGSYVRIEGKIRSRAINPEIPLDKQPLYEIIASRVQLMTNDALAGTTPNRQPEKKHEIEPAQLDVDKLPF